MKKSMASNTFLLMILCICAAACIPGRASAASGILTRTKTCDMADLMAASIGEESGEIDVSSIQDEDARKFFLTIQDIAHSLTSYSDFNPDKLNLHIINSKEVNAFALPCGHVFLTVGIIEYILDNYGNTRKAYSQIAAVLSHEIGHEALRHSETTLKTMSMAKPVGVKAASDQLNLTRQDELEADSYGAMLLVAAGFDANDMIAMLSDMRGKYGDSTTIELISASDHPSYTARIESLKPQTDEIDKAWHAYNLAHLLIDAEEYQDAIDMLTIAGRIFTKSPGIHNNLAVAYFGLALQVSDIYKAAAIPLKVSLIQYQKPTSNILERSISLRGNSEDKLEQAKKYLALARSNLKAAAELDPDNPALLSNAVAIDAGLAYLTAGGLSDSEKKDTQKQLEEDKKTLYDLASAAGGDRQLSASIDNNMMIVEFALFLVDENRKPDDLKSAMAEMDKHLEQGPDPALSWNACAIGLSVLSDPGAKLSDEQISVIAGDCVAAVMFQCWEENSPNLKLISDSNPGIGDAIKKSLAGNSEGVDSECRKAKGASALVLASYVDGLKDDLKQYGLNKETLKKSLKPEDIADVVVNSGKPDDLIKIDDDVYAMVYSKLGFLVYAVKKGSDYLPIAINFFDPSFKIKIDGKTLSNNDPLSRVYKLMGDPDKITALGSNEVYVYTLSDGLIGLEIQDDKIVSIVFFVGEA